MDLNQNEVNRLKDLINKEIETIESILNPFDPLDYDYVNEDKFAKNLNELQTIRKKLDG